MPTPLRQPVPAPARSRARPPLVNRPAQPPARLRAVVLAAMLFATTCAGMGVLGTVVIQDVKVVAIYWVAVVAFASWTARNLYRDRLRP